MSGSTRDVKGRARNERCPCGSGRKRKACCRTSPAGDEGATHDSAAPIDEGPPCEVVELVPGKLTELLAVMAAAGAHDEHGECPVCALQARWAREAKAGEGAA